MLIATRLRDDLHPAEKGRGAIDKGRGAIERIRRDTVYADARMVHLEQRKQAQGQLLFGGIERIGRWFRGAVRFGDPLLFEGLFLFVPGTELGSRLIESTPDGEGDFRGHQPKKDQALPPEIASTFLIAQFVEMRERMARLSSAGCPYRR